MNNGEKYVGSKKIEPDQKEMQDYYFLGGGALAGQIYKDEDKMYEYQAMYMKSLELTSCPAWYKWD